MVEILLKNKEIIEVGSVDEISAEAMDFYAIQFVDYTERDISWAGENFGINCSLMRSYQDIEISSHFLTKNDQTAFHISIPHYCSKEKGKLIESPIFFVMSDSGLFFFSTSAIRKFFNHKYSHRFSELQEVRDIRNILMYHLEFISDYYADITESEAKQIKNLAGYVLLENKSSKEVAERITTYNFNNLLLKESLLESTRVLSLYKKSIREQDAEIKEFVDTELNDLAVVSDYIEFNFDRLDNLRENIKNKIDLEQNYIFKVLTVITLCLSLPAIITGVYGMNFINMPELDFAFGYPLVLLIMVLSTVLPYLYFKRKNWM